MTYKLRFHDLALKEWNKLSPDLRDLMKKKLVQRLENPHIPSAALWGMEFILGPFNSWNVKSNQNRGLPTEYTEGHGKRIIDFRSPTSVPFRVFHGKKYRKISPTEDRRSFFANFNKPHHVCPSFPEKWPLAHYTGPNGK